MEVDVDRSQSGGRVTRDLTALSAVSCGRVALLTGGGDRPYAFGLATALMSRGVGLDLIGSDELDCPEFRGKDGVSFLNLRGNQRADVSPLSKASRVLIFYAKLVRYALTAKPRIFHILWNNKFESFDRTLLTLYYRFLGKKVVLTVHNVNAARRDSKDTRLNRLTLRIQYSLADHIFVHSEKMKAELFKEFGVQESRVTVIPFGINNAVPNTSLTSDQARQRLGIRANERTILFFGNITPYKGLEYLVAALQQIFRRSNHYRLIIAGRLKDCENYWSAIREKIDEGVKRRQILLRVEFIPDEEIEIYFKAADVLVLPYRHIYQSGVLFLGYSFGLPALVADVGSLKNEILEGKTGFVFEPEDPVDLAKAMETYFSSDLYRNLAGRRREIQDYARATHGWNIVGQVTIGVYNGLLKSPS